MKKNKLLLIIPFLALSGCQVTGEQTNLYQKVLSNVGTSVKTLPLVASENIFSIYIPKSEFNERSPLKGLVGTHAVLGARDQDWNLDHYYFSTYRQLFDTRGKLNLCHVMSQRNKNTPIDSRSCSDVTLNTEVQTVTNGYRVIFKATGLDVSTDNYGFFMKNDAPNLLQADGTLKTEMMISMFGYKDFFKKPLNISLTNYQIKYREQQAKDRYENPVLYLSFSELMQDRKASMYVNCTVSVDYEVNKPTAYCHYSIFGKRSINDYRPYNAEAVSYLNNFIKRV